MTKTKIEIYRDKKGEWRWRMKRAGRVVGDGYKRQATCLRSLLHLIDSLQRKAFVVERDGVRIGKDGRPLP